MRRFLRIITIFILIATLSVLCCGQGLAVDGRISSDIDAVLKERMEEAGVKSLQELVWHYADNAGNGEEWYVVSLRQLFPGELDFSEYRKAYEKHAEGITGSATAKLKAALVLQAVGSSSPVIDRAADEAIGQLGIMSYVYGLHILNNGAKSEKFSADSVIDTLLGMQLPDGGWAVMGDGGDVDVTAMTIQALAPHCERREDVKAAAEKATDLLASRQREDGTFISFGEANAESTAQVLLALSSLGIDCTQDERFIKNGRTVLDVLDSFKLTDGAYAHSAGGGANDSATLQAFYSLAGYSMFLQGKGCFLVFGEFSEPSVPRPEGQGGKTEPQPEPAKEAQNIKPLLWGIVAAAAVIACIALILLKKRSYKSYLFVVIVAAVIAAGIGFINIEKPSDYYGGGDEITDPIKTVISIRCDTVAGEKDYIPKDGTILERYEVVINDGQTAYDQLISAVRANSIHIDVNAASYVSGIANIYELDFGDLSGWMYRVNGTFADVNSSEKKLSEGDFVEWLYTRNIGKDIGNEYNGGD